MDTVNVQNLGGALFESLDKTRDHGEVIVFVGSKRPDPIDVKAGLNMLSPRQAPLGVSCNDRHGSESSLDPFGQLRHMSFHAA